MFELRATIAGRSGDAEDARLVVERRVANERISCDNRDNASDDDDDDDNNYYYYYYYYGDDNIYGDDDNNNDDS